jgi:putative membrane protein
MMFWNGGNWSFWEVAAMWAGMIAFWGLLIWAVYALIGNASRHHVTHHHDDHPVRILDQRLARGDIDTDEYRRLRDLLSSTTDHPAGHGSRQ